jgi:diaminohydroxyphosphoribosylaminopyrimidine deaminase/5-amino-6-(5-phosphoribosylamino)uracil reductase
MATQQEVDSGYMLRAIELAKLGTGHVSPNPLVGCVIVRDGQILAEGWHEYYGGVHAEVHALRNAADADLTGATMYVTLEPCAHHGKQPPCADMIAATPLERVVVGCLDPNPLVAGKGLDMLRRAGKQVEVGIEQQACEWTARYFLHAMRSRVPYIVGKMALTQNGGYDSTASKDRWITSEESRQRVHAMRAEVDAVMVGIGTVLADNPALNVRLTQGRNPVRIVLDPACRMPLDSVIAETAHEQRTIVVTTESGAHGYRSSELQQRGVELIVIGAVDGRMHARDIALQLFTEGIQSILLEGGPVTLDNFLHAKLIEEMHIHRAPFMTETPQTWDFEANPTTWQLYNTSTVGCDTHQLYRKITSYDA